MLEGLQGALNSLQLGVCGWSPLEQFFLLVDLQDLVLYLSETFLKAVARQVMIILQQYCMKLHARCALFNSSTYFVQVA